MNQLLGADELLVGVLRGHLDEDGYISELSLPYITKAFWERMSAAGYELKWANANMTERGELEEWECIAKAWENINDLNGSLIDPIATLRTALADLNRRLQEVESFLVIGE